MKIIGSFVSPYVRKVLAVMEFKRLAYEVDPITPFFGNDEFERLSPLRRIPVLIDGDYAWVPAIQCSSRVFNDRREGMKPGWLSSSSMPMPS